MSKIILEVDKKSDEGYPHKRRARGQMTPKDGRHYSSFMGIARGEPESPLGAEEMDEKFLFYAREILRKKALEVRGQVKDLEKAEKVRGLVRKLKGWENGSV
jgi:2-methylcitrate dehydratase PrpD